MIKAIWVVCGAGWCITAVVHGLNDNPEAGQWSLLIGAACLAYGFLADGNDG